MSAALIDNSSNNDDESDEDNTMDVFEQFLKYRKKKASRKKRTNSLVHEATRLKEKMNLENTPRKNPAHGRSHWSRRKLHCKCPSEEEKERKPPKERTVKPSGTGLCKSGRSTHGPTTKSRNAATKGYNKRIYMTGKGNVWSKK